MDDQPSATPHDHSLGLEDGDGVVAEAAGSLRASEGPIVPGMGVGETAVCSLPSTLPPGYMLVTVVLEGQTQPAVDRLPVEVLPCHTFADVCTAALARVPEAPQEYDLQAYMVLEALDVPLQDPHTPARDTLRTFPAAAGLRFHVGPPSGRAGPRTVRASRLAPRRQRKWPRRLAKIAIGLAKLVMAVEAAALLRGGAGSALRQLRRAAGWGGDSDSDVGSGVRVGSETEEALDAVAAYVSGRADMSVLRGLDPRVVVGALETMDTEVLEQLDVPDVADTKAAIATLLGQLREDQEAAAAAAAAAASTSGRAADSPSAASQGPSAGSGAAEPPSAGSSGNGAAGPGVGAAKDGASDAAGATQEPLPGFGPGTPTGTGSSRGGRGR